MIEEQKARIDDAMLKLLEDVDKAFIRNLQGNMFRCGAACCDDKTSSMQSIQKCIETCARPLETAQNLVRNEFNHFQDRLQRCVMTCNDSVRDKMGADTKESEKARYITEFEDCAKKCVDTHIDIIPELLKRIKDILKNV